MNESNPILVKIGNKVINTFDVKYAVGDRPDRIFVRFRDGKETTVRTDQPEEDLEKLAKATEVKH